MRPITKMQLMTRGRDGESGYRDRTYRGGGGNGMENRFRDGQGRERYNDGRYAPMNHWPPYYNDGPYDRFRDRTGREHYDNGRFAPRNESEFEGNVVINRIPPIYEESTGYRYDGGGNRMIGFAGGEMRSNYPMDVTHQNYNEMEHRRSPRQAGYASSDVMPMTKETAQKWVRKMHNADGSTGEHWSYDQTTQVMKQRNINCDPAEFYAVMNMLWSDYGKVAEKFGVSSVDYWAELAKAFLMDQDAMEDKLALYYECVVKK